MRNLKIILSTLFIFIFVFSLCLVVVDNNIDEVNADYIDEKIYQEIDVNADFSENTIIVILTKQETLKFKNYKAADFSNISCLMVTNLMKETEEFVKNQKSKDESNNVDLVNHNNSKTVIDLENYRGMLKLTVENKGKEHIIECIQELMKMPEIKIASPNYRIKPQKVHSTSTLRYQWSLEDINIENAWNYTTGSEEVLVGVVDSGIDGTHPELSNQIEKNLCLDLVSSTNILTPEPIDETGHGTNVAGIIAAQGVENGIVGICWNIKLVSLRVFDKNNNTYEDSLIRAVNYANYNNISILNFSLTWEGGTEIAFEYALNNYRGLSICAAGNDDRNTDINPCYPAFYTTNRDNVISVGAIKRDNTRPTVLDWGYDDEDEPLGSNYGATTVDIFAPGDELVSSNPLNLCVEEEVYDPYNGGSFTALKCEKYTNIPGTNQWTYTPGHVSTGYHATSGTSMAAPHVTGVAALIKSYNPSLTPSEIKNIIIQNDTNVDALTGLCVSGGKLDAYKALSNTPTAKLIYSDFGYKDETNIWKGEVYLSINGEIPSYSTLLPSFSNNETLDLRLTTKQSSVYEYITGTIEYKLTGTNYEETTVATQIVGLNDANGQTVLNRDFSINTGNLNNGTYTLNLYSSFSKSNGEAQETMKGYIFRVNHPVLVMENFGYLTSWYNWKGQVYLENENLYSYLNNSSGLLKVNKNTNLNFEVRTKSCFNAVHSIDGNVTLTLKNSSNETIQTHTSTIRVGLVSNSTINNANFIVNTENLENDTYTIYLSSSTTRKDNTVNNTASYSFVLNKPSSSCITEGTKVTLSDGTQVNVENLTGNETLLAWDMFNGCLISAPILFIDRENIDTYNVINLTFSDGTVTNVVSDHGFFDVTLGKYVYITEDTAYDYIGHSFNKGNTNVSLISVNIQEEYTRVYSPVTYGYLCYYTNGMLSMPGNTEIFANIFSIDSETLRYTNVNEDIENYGLYTYEEFNNLIEIDEYVFNAFKGEYLKIAIEKGITNLNEIQALLDRYSVFFE